MLPIQFTKIQSPDSNHFILPLPASDKPALPPLLTKTQRKMPSLVPDTDDVPRLEGRVTIGNVQPHERQVTDERIVLQARERHIMDQIIRRGVGATIDLIPSEILARCILARLTPEQVARTASLVCHAWHETCQDNLMWNYLLQCRFPGIEESHEAQAVFKRLCGDAHLNQGIYTTRCQIPIHISEREVLSIGDGKLAKTNYTKDDKAEDDETEKCSIQIWDLKTGTLEKTFSVGDGRVSFLGWEQEGLISVERSIVKLWDLHTGEILKQIDISPDQTICPALDSQGNLVLSTFKEGKLQIRDFANGELIKKEEGLPFSQYGGSRKFCLSKDKKNLVVGEHTGNRVHQRAVTVINLKTGERKTLRLSAQPPFIGSAGGFALMEPATIESVACLGNQKIAALSTTGVVGVWNSNGSQSHQLNANCTQENTSIKAKSFVATPEGNLIAFYETGVIEVIDLKSSSRNEMLEFHRISSADTSPYALSYQSNGTIVVCDSEQTRVLDLSSDIKQVFEELAKMFQSGVGEEINRAMIRFQRMPYSERDKIYRQLRIIKEASEEGTVEPVSDEANEEFFLKATPQERADAIRKYLQQSVQK